MIILVEGVNSKDVEERLNKFREELEIDFEGIDCSDFKINDYLKLIKKCKYSDNDYIWYNTFITDQARKFVLKEEPTLTNNEIISICSMIQNDAFIAYCVDDNPDVLYERSSEFSSKEEFVEYLRAYNITVAASKTLLPVIPYKV
jgi:hypothetical protein